MKHHRTPSVNQEVLHGEPELLYSEYKKSLNVAMDNALHSIAFPLISVGIYGYPLRGAWEQATSACNDFIDEYPDYEMNIIFAVLDNKWRTGIIVIEIPINSTF